MKTANQSDVFEKSILTTLFLLPVLLIISSKSLTAFDFIDKKTAQIRNEKRTVFWFASQFLGEQRLNGFQIKAAKENNSEIIRSEKKQSDDMKLVNLMRKNKIKKFDLKLKKKVLG